MIRLRLNRNLHTNRKRNSIIKVCVCALYFSINIDRIYIKAVKGAVSFNALVAKKEKEEDPSINEMAKLEKEAKAALPDADVTKTMSLSMHFDNPEDGQLEVSNNMSMSHN